jgi:hypothetical protein
MFQPRRWYGLYRNRFVIKSFPGFSSLQLNWLPESSFYPTLVPFECTQWYQRRRLQLLGVDVNYQWWRYPHEFSKSSSLFCTIIEKFDLLLVLDVPSKFLFPKLPIRSSVFWIDVSCTCGKWIYSCACTSLGNIQGKDVIFIQVGSRRQLASDAWSDLLLWFLSVALSLRTRESSWRRAGILTIESGVFANQGL